MAQCDINIPNPEEYLNLVKQKARPYDTSVSQSSTTTIGYLEDSQVKWKLVDDLTGEVKDKQKYTLLGGDFQLDKRITDEINKRFRKRQGNTLADKYEQSESTERSITMGNMVHEYAKKVMDFLKEGQDLSNVTAEIGVAFKNQDAAESLVRGITDVFNQIVAKQAEINPEGQVEILTEQIVVDPKKNMGGSIDVLAIYSDNTASIFDYKTREAKPYQIHKFGKHRGKLKQSLVYEGKRDDYTIQLVGYKSILQDVYGLKDVRQARIVPIRADYEKVKVGRDTEGKDIYEYKDKVDTIEMGAKDSEFVRQFPVVPEKTKYKGINDYIESKLQQIDVLRQKRSKLKEKADRERITKKIVLINKTIQDVLVSNDLSTIGEDVMLTVSYLNNNMDTITDLGELKEYKDEMEYYSNIVSTFGNYLDSVRKSGREKRYKQLTEYLGTLQTEAGIMKEQLEQKIVLELKELIGEEHFNEYDRINAKKLGWWDKTLARLSEMDHPIFKAFKSIKDKAYYDKRRDTIAFHDEIKKIDDAFKKYAKENNLTRNQAIEQLINKKTGNFWSKYTKEFLDAKEEAKAEKNTKFINDFYQLTAPLEEVKEAISKERSEFIKQNKKRLNELKDIKVGNKVYKKAADLRKEHLRDLENWEASNNFLKETKGNITYTDAVFNNYNLEKYFKFDDKATAKFESAEYKKIQSIPALANYYNFMVEANNEFREMLGVNFKDIPTNFFTNIRKDMLQKFTENGAGSIKKGFGELIDSLQVREEDVFLGVRDMNTQELQRNIPIMFINPFKRDDNDMSSEKSYDIMHSTMLFAKMAYNYKYMNEIEAQSLALKDALSHRTETTEHTSEGKELKNKFKDTIKSKANIAENEVALFNKLLDYYLYGIKFSEKGKTLNVKGKQISTNKLLLAAKNMFASKTLAFAAIPAAAALIQGKTGAYIEGKKGVLYDEKQWRKGMGYVSRNLNDALKMARDLDIFTEDELSRLIHKSQSGSRKLFDTRTMHTFLRTADEAIDLGVMMGMLQNFGIDENGNVRRLENLPEGAKPLFDVEKKELQKLSKDQYIQIRNAIKKGSIKIKGAMSDDDISMMNTNLAMNVLMQFKTWMPGILTERFGGEKYDEDIDAFEVGRFTAVYKDFNFDSDLALSQWFGKVVAPKLGAISLELATFGLATPYSKMKNGKVNWNEFSEGQKKRIQARYKAFIAANPTLENTVTLDQFVLANQRAIKAALWEMRMVMIFGAITALLGAKGDDGEPLYAEMGWFGRTLYKTLNRGAAEVSFTLNPKEFINLVRNPLPISKLLVDMMNTIENTADETRDFVFGENSPNDRSPIGFHASKWVPGIQQGRKVFDFVYENDKRNTY